MKSLRLEFSQFFFNKFPPPIIDLYKTKAITIKLKLMMYSHSSGISITVFIDNFFNYHNALEKL